MLGLYEDNMSGQALRSVTLVKVVKPQGNNTLLQVNVLRLEFLFKYITVSLISIKSKSTYCLEYICVYIKKIFITVHDSCYSNVLCVITLMSMSSF